MKSKMILGAAAVVLLLGVGLLIPATSPRPQQAFGAAGSSDKYDGDCTGTETEGRCADKSFDHSNCQYPTRWSNPVDGCDNSDPAVPECIKSFDTQESEQSCIAAFVAQQQPTTAPVTNTNQCGGK